MKSAGRSFVPGLALIFLSGVWPGKSRGADASTPPLRLKSGQAQLFVDDLLISEQRGLSRTLRQPKKDQGGNEPVLALAGEFGETKATLEANGTILFDPKLGKWMMFALAFASGYPG